MAASYKSHMYRRLLLLLVVYCSLIQTINCARLNAPKVLLPFYKRIIVNYTLEVTEPSGFDACYIWKTSRPEVAVVELINQTSNDCSMTARVSAVSKSSQRMTAIVTAENRGTGEALRCYVIVDALTNIQIATTTRELFLEDTPADLFVHGFDDQGNSFDNLQGIEFEWTLISDKEVKTDHIVDAHNVLRIVTFMESSYETPPHIADLEARGLQGDRLLVDGIKTGTAKIRAKVKDSVWKNSLESNTVRLVVRANLLISPPDAYVLLKAVVPYKVDMIKKSRIHPILMPSKQYYLEVVTPGIATLDVVKSTITALEVGDTEIVLKDRNIQSIEEFNPPSAMVHVVTPGYLAFTCLPIKKFILQKDEPYDILMDLFDKDSHKIYPSDNVMIKSIFDPEYFNVFMSTTNGTYHRVVTLKRGTTQIHGTLLYVDTGSDKLKFTPEVRHVQDVEIYDKIKVIPPVLYFPCDPQAPPYTYTLRAEGGSGEYLWQSSDTAVASVTVKGQITTVSEGRAQVTALDVKNHANFGSMLVYLLPAAHIAFIPSRVEALIGTTLTLPIALYAVRKSEKFAFDLCHLLTYNITVADSSIFQFSAVSKPMTDGCALLSLLALSVGNTQVTVEYHTGSSRLQTTVTVATYRELIAVDPEEIAVVTPGSSKDIIFDGGPTPWTMDSTKFYTFLSYQREANVIKHTIVKPFELLRSFHVFQITCINLGDLDLTLVVGNGPTARNRYPANSSVEIKFSCANPVAMQLIPELPKNAPDIPPCPALQDISTPIPIHCSREANILVFLYDSSGRQFDVFSALDIKWVTSDSKLGSIQTPPSILSEAEPTDNVRKKYKHYQLLKTYGDTGKLVVTASIKAYDPYHLALSGCKVIQNLEKVITKSIDLMLVNEPSLQPSAISVFNHPSNSIKLDIVDGSGHFFVLEGRVQSCDIVHLKKNRKIQISPLNDGVRKVILHDLCLEQSEQAFAMVTVSGVEEIEFTVVDKIPVSQIAKARVRVLDTNNEPLSASFFPLMNLRPIAASDIIKIKLVSNVDEFTAMYEVIGAFVGHTSLSFQVTSKNGLPITSAPRPIEVFPPLRLSPRNVTLIIGAQLQVIATGGPSPSSSIVFTLATGNVAVVSTVGLLEATGLGHVTLVGKAQGYDPEAQQIIEYSRMPIHASGLTEHETPLSFGSSVPPLNFVWSVNNKDVVKLHSIYHQSSIVLPDENNFAKQVIAAAPGHVTISLHVTVSLPANLESGFTMETYVLTDEVHLQVFDGLQLLSPPVGDHVLLISPNTNTKIVTNRDGGAKVSYQILHKDPPSLGLSVDLTGIVTTTDVTGFGDLLVTSQESIGINHTLYIKIQVKPVSYLMLNTDSIFQSSSAHLNTIPVGAKFHLYVSFHDSSGRQFHATNRAIDFRLNRYDRLQVSSGMGNNSLMARAADSGHTVLKVWSRGDSRIADYINVPVDYVIDPKSVNITLGDVICFRTLLATDQGHPGTWTTSNKVLHIEADSGVAMAIGLGTGLIEYAVSHDLITYSEVHVSAVHNIHVRCPYTYLTNSDERRSYFIPVGLGNDHNVLGDNCSAKLREMSYKVPVIPFRCTLEMSDHDRDVTMADLFSTRATFDPQSGQYGCDITRANNHYLTQRISSLNIHFTLSIYVPQHDPQLVHADPVTLQFYPAFYVHHLAANAIIELSNHQRHATLRVTASPKMHMHLQLISSHPSIVEVHSVQTDLQNSATLVYPIVLLETYQIWMQDLPNVTLTVFCRANGQHEEIHVNIKIKGVQPEHLKSSDSGWAMFLQSIIGYKNAGLILMFSAIFSPFIAVIVYYALMGPRYGMTASPGTFSPPGSPALIMQGTPHASPTPPFGYPRAQDYYSNTPYNIGNTPLRLWSTGYRPQESSPTRQRQSPHSAPGSPY